MTVIVLRWRPIEDKYYIFMKYGNIQNAWCKMPQEVVSFLFPGDRPLITRYVFFGSEGSLTVYRLCYVVCNRLIPPTGCRYNNSM